ncbi:MAG: MATE family efflux transporter [Clostridia bacterium]|nr:MATE family efflux transporter [Clostridia bacterium]
MEIGAKKGKYEIDMCNGPLFSKIVRFTLPLMLSGMLQLLYNAADVIVVGRFAGKQALAAVSSTGSLVGLLVNVFLGLSIGANTLISRRIGANDVDGVKRGVHTAITVSLIAGVLGMAIGLSMCRQLLELMQSPDDVIDLSTLYLRIYFLGLPMSLLYNFGASIMRSSGDTKRPLYFLAISGVVNVCFNLIFVIVFNMGVAGVAIATVISQTLSAVFVVIALTRTEGMLKLNLKKLRIYKAELKEILYIGIPAGLNGCLFSISNMLIQSSINSFGSDVIAGNGAAANIEAFVWTGMNSFHQAAINFISQNRGANKPDRMRKAVNYCLLLVVIIGATLGAIALLFSRSLLTLYNTDPAVIEAGVMRMRIICTTYFLCGIMDVMLGVMRGYGYSIVPTIVALCGVCAFRVIWIFGVFAFIPTRFVLYLSYPVSWVITAIAHYICYLYARKKLEKKIAEQKTVDTPDNSASVQ